VQSGAGAVNPTHSVHATARRSRGRADEYVAVGRGVRIQAEHRSRDEPAQVHAPAHHIAADAVGFLRLEAPRRPGAALADDVAKAWGKTFDLTFDGRSHVRVGAVRHVAVRPGDMLAVRSPRAVKE